MRELLEMPERIWANGIETALYGRVRKWWPWDRRPAHKQGAPYLRADTVVDKAVAEKMAEALRARTEAWECIDPEQRAMAHDLANELTREVLAAYDATIGAKNPTPPSDFQNRPPHPEATG